MADDHQLLVEFARENSEAAFAALVKRHVGLVYSAALRRAGNAHAAEEITQAVFIILACKADGLSAKIILSGWLYQTTRLTAANFLRTEIRRQHHEQEAYMQSLLNDPDTTETWTRIAPLLDDALDKLGTKDRDALALRFFENKSMAEIGAALGASEDAAKMRVNRALEKLRKIFTKRGVTLSALAIAGAVSANSVQAAPAGLVKTISVVAFTKGAAAGGSTLALVKGALKLMAWTKMKTVVAVGVATVLVATTTTAVVENIFKNLDTDPTSADKLESLAPDFIIRPTQYPNGRVGFQTPSGKSISANTSIQQIIRHAYGFSTSVRMILPNDLPKGQFDYLNSLAEKQKETLRAELKKQFGLVAHTATNDTDVLLLQVRDADKLKAHLVQNGKPGKLGTFRMSRGKANDAITGFESMQLAELLETIFQKPVVDKTGLDSFYEWKSESEIHDQKSKNLQENWLNKIDLFGLELAPSREPVEMLVVERVK